MSTLQFDDVVVDMETYVVDDMEYDWIDDVVVTSAFSPLGSKWINV